MRLRLRPLPKYFASASKLPRKTDVRWPDATTNTSKVERSSIPPSDPPSLTRERSRRQQLYRDYRCGRFSGHAQALPIGTATRVGDPPPLLRHVGGHVVTLLEDDAEDTVLRRLTDPLGQAVLVVHSPIRKNAGI